MSLQCFFQMNILNIDIYACTVILLYVIFTGIMELLYMLVTKYSANFVPLGHHMIENMFSKIT